MYFADTCSNTLYAAATSQRLARLEAEAASAEEERKRKVGELQDLATEASSLKEQNGSVKAKLQSAKSAAATLATALGTEFSLPQDLTAVLASLDAAILAPAMQRLTTVVSLLCVHLSTRFHAAWCGCSALDVSCCVPTARAAPAACVRTPACRAWRDVLELCTGSAPQAIQQQAARD